MSQQTTTATNWASFMHAVIHAWYMSGLVSRSVYIAIADSGPWGPRYIGATLYYYFSEKNKALDDSHYVFSQNNNKKNLDSSPTILISAERVKELDIKSQILLEQVDGAPSHIPMPVPSHISVHIKIPNAFLSWPPDMPPGQNVCTTVFCSYYLPLDMQYDYVCIKWILDPSGPHPTALRQRVKSKFRMCSSSPHPQGYRLWKFRDSSLNDLGAIVRHYRRTYGWTNGRRVSQYPRFFFEKRGDKN